MNLPFFLKYNRGINFVFCLFVFNSSYAYGQFGHIHDSDGYVNIRDAASVKSPVVHKLLNNNVVYLIEPTGNWGEVMFLKNQGKGSGFVYLDRIKQMDTYSTIPFKKTANGITVFEDKLVRVTLTESVFHINKHQLTYAPTEGHFLQKIDGKTMYGTDGNIPNTGYNGIEIMLNDALIRLPKRAYEDLFEPNFESTQVNYNAAKDIVYIQSINSDGAGSYSVLWVIDKGTYAGRYIGGLNLDELIFEL